ncbi:MAG: efflux transporter periplasmic adaptor subunit [Hydrogenophaga sp. SCN 70-13]|jgi:membrane fusion protein (multidrug efflux system)|uniref:efflux RND transporter periplasmic adaptor subunit n=2 Tax=Hydrogenophaga TaxID=47420 RepID=UPI00086EAD9B|nr:MULTISPECIES: efflux RND transporter periplasmic adaptor subunit [unclassified Hydrogenophaga]MBN9371341.1 efflux RND transporter periplasmic adaptor subunit [Hydrogenophaga sp.]ODT34275.1 MAG: efflux transporter periplasmic adaptor subunit [Hydrogenophaga sp. SCN 70-13]
MPSSFPLPRSRAAKTLVAIALAALVVACGKQGAPAQAGGGAPPPPEVGVITVALGDVGLVNELPGRLEASRVSEVRARAAGILQQRLFREGSEVKAGQRLFQIDPAPYQATLQSARATLARAEANLTQAKALAERYAPLVKENAISQQEYANAQAAQKQAEADVAAGRAAVQTANINLGYANVTAPISGRIGRALVTEGALVGQGEPTPLAVIQQINPMYVNFTQSASEVYRLRRALQSGSLKGAGDQVARVKIVLEDGSVYGRDGRLLFSDLTVDSATGQVTLRAEVPNPDGVLLPGLYVRVRIEQATAGNALLLPQQAVTRTAQGDSVMVVDGEGKVAPRNITVRGQQEGQWVVTEGLKAGDQVMVDGFQKLRPGGTVKPVPWKKPGEQKPNGAAPSKAS